MSKEEIHPMTRFLYEIREGKIGYNPPSEEDPRRHWIYDWENGEYNFNFVVSDREEAEGLEIRPKSLQWIGRFVYGREIEYLGEPCSDVKELVSESVEIKEEPLDIGLMERYCPECHLFLEVNVMPKMDLVINGYPAQRVFEETCPDCGERVYYKKTYSSLDRQSYPEDVSELDESELWEHSRRTP